MLRQSHDPLAWVDDALDDLQRTGLRRRLAVRGSEQSARVIIDGKSLINFGSNDYLGLAADPRLSAAAATAAEREGWGSGASPLVSGRAASHAELERRLAEFEGTEAALVFPSGFAANAGVIPALVDEPDAIFADAKNHASLIDGCRLSRAKRFVYPHSDCEALEAMLQSSGGFRRRLIVTDTLFSMDGDLAPLGRLAELAEQHDAMLMVDEAHATGVFGEHGRGVAEYISDGCLGSSLGRAPREMQNWGLAVARRQAPKTELEARIHIRVGTLSKALGTGGGFVCGRQSLIEWLANAARTYVFSTAQPAATSAAAIAALDIIRAESQRGGELLERAAGLRARLAELGRNTGRSESQIIPIFIGDPNRTMALAADLRRCGFFVPGIRPPSVPEGESLLRISLCHHHTPEMVDALLTELGRLST